MALVPSGGLAYSALSEILELVLHLLCSIFLNLSYTICSGMHTHLSKFELILNITDEI